VVEQILMDIIPVIYMLLSRYFGSLEITVIFVISFYFKASQLYFFPLYFLQVREDPVFRREGLDIHVDAVLSITQVMFNDENLEH
jgi:hypothetical protein